MLDKARREYITDVEGLRKEVELIFQAKLGKVRYYYLLFTSLDLDLIW